MSHTIDTKTLQEQYPNTPIEIINGWPYLDAYQVLSKIHEEPITEENVRGLSGPDVLRVAEKLSHFEELESLDEATRLRISSVILQTLLAPHARPKQARFLLHARDANNNVCQYLLSITGANPFEKAVGLASILKSTTETYNIFEEVMNWTKNLGQDYEVQIDKNTEEFDERATVNGWICSLLPMS